MGLRGLNCSQRSNSLKTDSAWIFRACRLDCKRVSCSSKPNGRRPLRVGDFLPKCCRLGFVKPVCCHKIFMSSMLTSESRSRSHVRKQFHASTADIAVAAQRSNKQCCVMFEILCQTVGCFGCGRPAPFQPPLRFRVSTSSDRPTRSQKPADLLHSVLCSIRNETLQNMQKIVLSQCEIASEA